MDEWDDLDDLEEERPPWLSLPFERWPLWCHQRLIEQPDALVEKARELLSSERWEEEVVGLTLVTGRCVPEILKTGVLFPKKRYTLLFTAHLERIDEVVGPFELPTLVEAEEVILAWQRVRIALVCTHLNAEQICRTYRPQVSAVAREHFADLLAVDPHGDGYTPLLRRIYALIASRYYCPMRVVHEWFMDLVQGFDWSERDSRIYGQWCEECRRSCYTYAISDGAGNIAGGKGLKLEREGVEPLERFRSKTLNEQA
ncbi:protelomerase family protein [Dictyobacter arantiisoli]|uniref:Telomere resolvase ResT/TelK catalytic domain-containing protein n=1 Tax=Dictyobacter arantiisoli TaxID=2014874 RepID=A0A5A5TK42_9CHLR|nr:protelomerase family protein [Dictyobacter arantiisoli]GCF11399.1 hypothetical protein KDI_49630 [Dictyobacter arantiisoli]